METRINRRLAADRAADIAGYSRLMGEDEAATVRDLEGHQAEVLPLVTEFGGRVIDVAGDGILAEFQSAVAAVECAMQIQARMARRNLGVTEARCMRFRIGINLGVDPFNFVDIHAALGDVDLALQLAEKAYEDRSPQMAYLLIAKGLYPQLWDRPRFRALEARLQFPPPGA